MITEQNMIFANPQAYRVFPNMSNPMNTGLVEKAVYTGHLVVTDSSGNTKNFSHTDIIDFTGFTGTVDINQFTDVGSVALGRWKIAETQSDIVSSSEAVAADILMYDKVNNEKFILRSTADFSKYPAESYTPIGIVVVPGTHNVYGDGSCGVMSLREMNYSTPDEGSTSRQGIYWGQYDSDTSLPNLNQVPIVGTGSSVGDASSTVTEQFNYSYLPSDKFSAVQCPHDTDTYYYGSSLYKQAPSPYLTDGSRNPAYYQTTSPSSSSNALADFDGIGNSQILWELATSQSNWRTASSITNDYDLGYSPAACCCWRYHTEGTSQGDWYLPACGELGYIMPPFNKINGAIRNMQTEYGSSVGVELNTNDYCWSSTESSSGNARYVGTYAGYVGIYGKKYNRYVRAFLKYKDEEYTPIDKQSIKDSIVLWYDLKRQGATNESMQANPKLLDLSGNGHDATCYNFAWSEMSGIGGYITNFSKWGNNSNGGTVRDISDTKFVIASTTGVVNSNILYTNNVISSSFKIKVSNIIDGDIIVRIRGEVDDMLTITEDGEYEIAPSSTGLNIASSTERESCNITIELLPEYPNALVSDGVDDYAMVDGLPLLNKEDGYTVIGKRKILRTDIGNYVAGKGITQYPEGAFHFEGVRANDTYSFGRYTGITITTDDISYQTSTSYNGIKDIIAGNYTDNDTLTLFKYRKSVDVSNSVIALFSFILFNRDLTPDEINWVKTNLIEGDTEL